MPSFPSLLLLVLLTHFSPTSSMMKQPLSSSRNYVPPESGFDSHSHHKGVCGRPCIEGGCRFEGCGRGEELDKAADCDGGLCEFISCTSPTCHGGGCTFITSTFSTCHGGGCSHINPEDTLKDYYCEGGGCTLNGVMMPTTLVDTLSI
ncbi:hypothetical protein TrLO_g10587 [Triparma laevis f. longispina]|uniref:Uncharacterized protein n=1 Tax=Triparma laevis f. longispina TaxID=1714387 RepID=A0A9W7FU19_9STRA|nr:hypothetical protein TrLO_g10587 [Triparma laevis f. longispina]